MAIPVLLPDRHPTRDFFIADIFDALPLKSDRHSLEHPFFSLSKKPDIRTVKYEHNGVLISMYPHTELGLPTIFDKDILLYLGSVVVAELNKGSIPQKKIRFSAHDLLVATNRHTNDVSYKLLKKAFERLTGCLVTTNIETNTVKESAGFHLIEKFRIIEKSHDKDRMVKLEATLSDWFYNALIGNEVLTINRTYFRLRKPLERRIYELARKHCGEQTSWIISLVNLRKKTGSSSHLNKFRFFINQIIKENHLPDYSLHLDSDDMVTFYLKSKQEDKKKRKPRKLLTKSKPSSPIRLRDYLKDGTLEAGQRITHEARTGWDYDYLIKEWEVFTYNSEQKVGSYPKNFDGAFINFIKKKVKSFP